MSKKVVIDGRQSLFRVAVDQYADPLLYIAILQENNTESPFILQPTALVIPDNPTQKDGLPNQTSGVGTGIIESHTFYPYTIETVDDKITLTRFQRGIMQSRTTGVGNKAN